MSIQVKPLAQFAAAATFSAFALAATSAKADDCPCDEHGHSINSNNTYNVGTTSVQKQNANSNSKSKANATGGAGGNSGVNFEGGDYLSLPNPAIPGQTGVDNNFGDLAQCMTVRDKGGKAWTAYIVQFTKREGVEATPDMTCMELVEKSKQIVARIDARAHVATTTMNSDNSTCRQRIITNQQSNIAEEADLKTLLQDPVTQLLLEDCQEPTHKAPVRHAAPKKFPKGQSCKDGEVYIEYKGCLPTALANKVLATHQPN